MYEGVDTVVLFEELAYEDVLPVQWTTMALPDMAQRRSYTERNIKLLQTCAALGDHSQPDKLDERTPMHADVLRIDMKVNLLLDLVGKILASSQQRPADTSIRFNTLGAIWKARNVDGLPLPGATGLLEIHLREFAIEPLCFLGRVTAVDSNRIKVRFENTGEAVADLLGKLAFRRHRRQVADVRQANRDA